MSPSLTWHVLLSFQILRKQLSFNFPIIFSLGQPPVAGKCPGFSEGRTIYNDLVQEPVRAEPRVIMAYAKSNKNEFSNNLSIKRLLKKFLSE